MSCEETKQSLSLYVDDALMLPARVAVDEHLDKCPVCRDEVVELRALTRGLSLLARPLPPADLAASINDALAIEVAARRQSPRPSFGERLARFLEPRLMPYSGGSVASVVLFIMVFAACDLTSWPFTRRPLKESQCMWVRLAHLRHEQPVRSEDYAASRAPLPNNLQVESQGLSRHADSVYAHPRTSQFRMLTTCSS